MNLSNRHSQCLEALKVLGNATAREVAEYMYNKGYTKVLERNIAHPRLNELESEGYIKVVGTKFDTLTERDVFVYERIK
ncbi:hypothetical protein N4T77_15685 [Clostridium sp. CX1]|uniref:hypothetical protein n=1 Tax=Clostridium sp. CX1 TaxID=2978346 RepID=UPI0021BED8D7|nr:hypothetical protein [Clostridium sp. CX1]MCT8978035.1 hypothetical protein [Clostridium sp. CX1]